MPQPVNMLTYLTNEDDDELFLKYKKNLLKAADISKLNKDVYLESPIRPCYSDIKLLLDELLNELLLDVPLRELEGPAPALIKIPSEEILQYGGSSEESIQEVIQEATNNSVKVKQNPEYKKLTKWLKELKTDSFIIVKVPEQKKVARPEKFAVEEIKSDPNICQNFMEIDMQTKTIFINSNKVPYCRNTKCNNFDVSITRVHCSAITEEVLFEDCHSKPNTIYDALYAPELSRDFEINNSLEDEDLEDLLEQISLLDVRASIASIIESDVSMFSIKSSSSIVSSWAGDISNNTSDEEYMEYSNCEDNYCSLASPSLDDFCNHIVDVINDLTRELQIE